MSNILLGVNIDHIATLRNVRGTIYPDPVQAAFIVEQAGADIVTVHLREDRRHITDRDVFLLRKTIRSSMNLEIAPIEEMISIACELKPDCCCLVPENRQEITTENGLDFSCSDKREISSMISQLQSCGIEVSLFLDANKEYISTALDLKVSCIELHTGPYVTALDDRVRMLEFKRFKDCVQYAIDSGLKVNAGHGLDYHNVKRVLKFPLNVLHIGHAIIARSVFSGLFDAVKDMKNIVEN